MEVIYFNNRLTFDHRKNQPNARLVFAYRVKQLDSESEGDGIDKFGDGGCTLNIGRSAIDKQFNLEMDIVRFDRWNF